MANGKITEKRTRKRQEWREEEISGKVRVKRREEKGRKEMNR